MSLSRQATLLMENSLSPGAEDAPGHRHLGVLEGQAAVVVAHGEHDLGHAERLGRARALEDHVLDPFPAEHAGALLAQDPAQGVGDVALAAAVGPHDGGDPAGERHLGAGGEGLEPEQLELLNEHADSSARTVAGGSP